MCPVSWTAQGSLVSSQNLSELGMVISWNGGEDRTEELVPWISFSGILLHVLCFPQEMGPRVSCFPMLFLGRLHWPEKRPWLRSHPEDSVVPWSLSMSNNPIPCTWSYTWVALHQIPKLADTESASLAYIQDTQHSKGKNSIREATKCKQNNNKKNTFLLEPGPQKE